MIQWHWVHPWHCMASMTISFQNFLVTPCGTSILVRQSLSHCPPSPDLAISNLLSKIQEFLKVFKNCQTYLLSYSIKTSPKGEVGWHEARCLAHSFLPFSLPALPPQPQCQTCCRVCLLTMFSSLHARVCICMALIRLLTADRWGVTVYVHIPPLLVNVFYEPLQMVTNSLNVISLWLCNILPHE